MNVIRLILAKHKWLVPLTITVFALIVRLGFWTVVDIPYEPQAPDAQNYVAMVQQWFDEGVYGYLSDEPNAYVTPGYPVFLAAIYGLLGFEPSTVQAVRLVQAVLSAATVYWVYDLTRRLAGVPAAVTAALAWGLYPPSIWATGSLLTETLYVFLLLMYLAFQQRLLDTPSLVNGAAAGLTLAACIMVRPSVGVLGIIPLWFVFRHWQAERRIPGWAWAGAGAILVVMLPWWIRNLITLDQFVMLATQTGNPLLAGTDPFFMNPAAVQGIPPERELAVAVQRIVDGFSSQPLLYLHWFTLGKAAVLFENPYWGGVGNGGFLRPLSFLHQFILVLGITGLVGCIRRPRWWPVVTAFILLLGVQLLFVPTARYGFPLMAVLIAPAAGAAVTIVQGPVEPASAGRMS